MLRMKPIDLQNTTKLLNRKKVFFIWGVNTSSESMYKLTIVMDSQDYFSVRYTKAFLQQKTT